jgi:hypothetical protein
MKMNQVNGNLNMETGSTEEEKFLIMIVIDSTGRKLIGGFAGSMDDHPDHFVMISPLVYNEVPSRDGKSLDLVFSPLFSHNPLVKSISVVPSVYYFLDSREDKDQALFNGYMDTKRQIAMEKAGVAMPTNEQIGMVNTNRNG